MSLDGELRTEIAELRERNLYLQREVVRLSELGLLSSDVLSAPYLDDDPWRKTLVHFGLRAPLGQLNALHELFLSAVPKAE